MATGHRTSVRCGLAGDPTPPPFGVRYALCPVPESVFAACMRSDGFTLCSVRILLPILSLHLPTRISMKVNCDEACRALWTRSCGCHSFYSYFSTGTCLAIIWFYRVIWTLHPRPDMRGFRDFGVTQEVFEESRYFRHIGTVLWERGHCPLSLWLIAEVIHSFIQQMLMEDQVTLGPGYTKMWGHFQSRCGDKNTHKDL